MLDGVNVGALIAAWALLSVSCVVGSVPGWSAAIPLEELWQESAVPRFEMDRLHMAWFPLLVLAEPNAI